VAVSAWSFAQAGNFENVLRVLAQPAGQQALLLAVGMNEQRDQQANAAAVHVPKFAIAAKPVDQALTSFQWEAFTTFAKMMKT